MVDQPLGQMVGLTTTPRPAVRPHSCIADLAASSFFRHHLSFFPTHFLPRRRHKELHVSLRTFLRAGTHRWQRLGQNAVGGAVPAVVS